MKKSACIVMAAGSEEMEVVITVDVLRRAGIEVCLAAVGAAGGTITASRGVRLGADADWPPPELDRFDLLVIPGGLGGVAALRAEPSVLQALKDFTAAGKYTASICAGPLVLSDAGLLAGKHYTCFPGCEKDIPDGERQDKPVVRDGKLITSQGPGTAFRFALTLIEELAGLDTAKQVAEGLLLWW